MLTRLFIIIGSAIVASVLLWVQPEVAEPQIHTRPVVATCPDTTLAAQFATADAVLSGQVTGVLPTSGELADVWVEPQTWYKGQPSSGNVKIVAWPSEVGDSSGPSRDLHFQSNDPPYLLFLRARSDGRFETSRCFGSRRLGAGLTEQEKKVLEAK